MELLLRSAALTCFGAPANRSPYDFCESVAKAIPIWHIKVSGGAAGKGCGCRSEEHTSELQSQFHLVCRLLLEKKKSPTFSLLPASVTASDYILLKAYVMPASQPVRAARKKPLQTPWLPLPAILSARPLRPSTR